MEWIVKFRWYAPCGKRYVAIRYRVPNGAIDVGYATPDAGFKSWSVRVSGNLIRSMDFLLSAHSSDSRVALILLARSDLFRYVWREAFR